MKCLKTLPDQELVNLFMDGKTDALSVLVYRHKDKIYTSIYFLVKDKYLAEDIFQDCFMKIIDTLKLKKYSEEGKFLPWAMRIAHNLCVDHFRKIKRMPLIKTSDDRDIFDRINASESSAEVDVMKRETMDSVSKMLDKLPHDQREIIILRHYANLSFKEIASITGCSINTALGRMRYGLINLRKMISENDVVLSIA